VPRGAVLRPARYLAALAVLALPVTPTLSTAQQEADYVELLIDLNIAGGPNQIVLALAGDTALYLGVRGFLELAEIRMTDFFPPRHLRGVVDPENLGFWFDGDSALIHRGVATRPLDSAAVFWRDNELYAATTVLEWVFGVSIRVNRADLSALVTQAPHLPVLRRIQRVRRRDRYDRTRIVVPPAVPVAKPDRLFDGAVLDWSVTSLTEDPLDGTSLQLGLGAQLLGGSAVVEHAERRTATGGTRETDASWIRVWHTTPYVRQVRVGDVLGTGREARLIQGASMTNSPFLRPAEFGAASLDGSLPPGWEVELYSNQRLIGVTTSEPDGLYQFRVPVRYGPNPVEVIGYGPRGEIRRLERTFEIAQERIPGGQFEYGVGAGRCAIDPCRALANADLRYGITDWVTIRTGADRFWRDTLPDLFHPYGSAAAQVTRAVSVSAEVVGNAFWAARAGFAPTPNLQTAAAHTRFVGDVDVPLLGSAFDRHRTDLSFFYRPGFLGKEIFARAVASRAVGDSRTRESVSLIGTTRVFGSRLDGGMRIQRIDMPPQPRATSTAFEARFFHVYTGSYRWLRRTLLRGSLGLDVDSGFTHVEFGLSRVIQNSLQVEIGTNWRRGLPGVALEIGLTASFSFVRAVSRNRFSTAENVRGTQVVEGSVLWERRTGRIGFGDGRALGRAGMTGIVFLDLNGNGAADPGEPPVPDIRLRIGPSGVTSDAAGRFEAWDLVPFEALIVEVDTLSIGDPLWLPLATRFTFRPDPNTFTLLPLPFVQAGEVSGRLTIDNGARALAGVPLVLTNLTTGDRYETVTYSDGGFYVLGVRPGRYEVIVDDRVLEALGARLEPAAFEIGRTRDDAIVEGVDVRLARGG